MNQAMKNSAPVSDPIASTHGHLDYLDGLRALAALYVVLYHSLLYVVGNVAPNPASKPIVLKLYSYFCFLAMQGHSAVTLFIMLSGFCLMLPITRHGQLRGGALNFFRKRALRILPTYFAAVTLSLLLAFTILARKTGTAWDGCIPVSLTDLISHVFLVQDIFTPTTFKINHSLWSISVEWRIYFLFPLILLAWKRFRPVSVAIALTAISLFLQYLLRYTPFNQSSSGMCLHYIGIFSIGMLACEVAFSQNRFSLLRKKVPWGILSTVLGFITLACARVLPTSLFFIQDIFVASAAFSVLVYLSTSQKGIYFNFVSSKALAFIGGFSYSIYLMHVIALQIISQYIISPLRLPWLYNNTLTILLGLPASIVIAYIFYLCLERPFIIAKR